MGAFLILSPRIIIVIIIIFGIATERGWSLSSWSVGVPRRGTTTTDGTLDANNNNHDVNYQRQSRCYDFQPGSRSFRRRRWPR